MACSALSDGAAEQTPGARHREQRTDAHAASRFTKDRDVVRVASEGCDVFLHPAKGGDLVKQTEVGVSLAQIAQEEEAVYAQAIVDGDAYHTIAGEATAVIRCYRARPIGERAPMNPDHHWQPGLPRVGGPDIEV